MMIEFNIRTIDAEIEKIALNKMTDVRQAERLGMLYQARKCLVCLSNKYKDDYSPDTPKGQIDRVKSVTDELNDILPALKEYQQAKSEFMQHKITQEGVNHHLQRLVVEINEFITVLYSNTTCPEEREILSEIKSR